MSLHPQRASQTPGSLIDGARMYAAAADAVNDLYPNSLHVLSHLLGMSIELAFNAYLLHTGLNQMELKRLDHTAGRLFGSACRLGIIEGGNRDFGVKVLGPAFQQRSFGYPRKWEAANIVPKRLRILADELISEFYPLMRGNDEFVAAKGKPGMSIQSEYPDDIFPNAWARKSRKEDRERETDPW